MTSIVGLAWVFASVEIEGKTPFRHTRSWWRATDPVTVVSTTLSNTWESWFGEDEADVVPAKPVRPKKLVKPAPIVKRPAVPPEEAATPKRVALLEKAQTAMREPKKPQLPKTRVDERLSNGDKKALDELVTSRVPPRR